MFNFDAFEAMLAPHIEEAAVKAAAATERAAEKRAEDYLNSIEARITERQADLDARREALAMLGAPTATEWVLGVEETFYFDPSNRTWIGRHGMVFDAA